MEHYITHLCSRAEQRKASERPSWPLEESNILQSFLSLKTRKVSMSGRKWALGITRDVDIERTKPSAESSTCCRRRSSRLRRQAVHALNSKSAKKEAHKPPQTPNPCPPAETNALNGPKPCKRARNPPSLRHLGLNEDEHRRQTSPWILLPRTLYKLSFGRFCASKPQSQNHPVTRSLNPKPQNMLNFTFAGFAATRCRRDRSAEAGWVTFVLILGWRPRPQILP